MDKIIYTADGIPVTVKRKRMRTIRLTVRPGGEVGCSAPFYTPEERISAFIREKSDWIKNQREKLLDSPKTETCYEDGEPFYYAGKKYVLRVSKDGKKGLYISGEEAFLVCDGTREEREKVVKKWYKARLLPFVTGFAAECAEATGLNPSSVSVRDMKTRWGTCNVKTKKITFATGLMRVSEDLIFYVALHEVLHIKVPNHGKEFKTLLDRYMPDWREKRKRLKNFPLY